MRKRAGRSGHSPGRRSRVTLVPTNSLELLEAAEARGATVLGLGDAATAYLLDLGHKGIGLIELFNIVATSDALAHQ